MASFHIRLEECVEKYEIYNFDFTEQDLEQLKQDFSDEDPELFNTLTLDILMAILDDGEYPVAFEDYSWDIKDYIQEMAYNQDFDEDYGDTLDREWRFTKNEN